MRPSSFLLTAFLKKFVILMFKYTKIMVFSLIQVNLFTSCTLTFTRLSDGVTMSPITLTFPWMVRASSGLSVFMPTRPYTKM